MARHRLSDRLPDFPWDSLSAARARAGAHPGGLVDLSIGTPVDPTPAIARDALGDSADSPGYPATAGSAALRAAIGSYLSRRWGVTGLEEHAVLPLIGSKEFVAWLPTLLGLGSQDTVMIPGIAYPTYAVGVAMAGCRVLAADTAEAITTGRPALVWLNSPSNPTGAVHSAAALHELVAAARSVGAIVLSDECYGEFGWDVEPVSVLDPRVCGPSHDGVLAVMSLSKRSNVAGYRAGLLAGDPGLVAELTAVRKQAGMIMPGPVQAAMVALLDDQEHVEVQRERYAARRSVMIPALAAAGFGIEHSQAGLYLWATRDEPCRISVDWLSDRGILVAPGDFYGVAAQQHIRVAMTATDDRIAAAADRLTG